LVGKYLRRKWQIPYIAMYHTLGAVKNVLGIGEEEPALRIVSERETVEDCQRIIVATEKEKQDLVVFYDAVPPKISVVPCGVNLELFKPIAKNVARKTLGLNDEKVLLFVGRIDPLKGIEQLIKTLPLLKNTDNLKLIVVGGDENSCVELEELKKLSVALGVRSLVTFPGLVRQERLPHYYSAADVCVVPSYYESFGLVALEALACGTPVVAADVGDLSNIIRSGETGYVTKDNSPERLAAGIRSLLSGPLPDKESALSIRASVSRFDWPQIAEKIAGEMRTVLESRLIPVAEESCAL
jgi:D-inositol-3-phosphate glycosyltransferase